VKGSCSSLVLRSRRLRRFRAQLALRAQLEHAQVLSHRSEPPPALARIVAKGRRQAASEEAIDPRTIRAPFA
jgi:hypothetical protein